VRADWGVGVSIQCQAKHHQDILKIGNQLRPDMFDLSVQRHEQPYEAVLEVDERVTIEQMLRIPSQRVSISHQIQI
jgi:N-methylhydantoinase A/oxoprolinase/acetone carboxylase beta subunit